MRVNTTIFGILAASLCLLDAWRFGAVFKKQEALALPAPPPIARQALRDAAASGEPGPWRRPLFTLPHAEMDMTSSISGTRREANLPRLIGVVLDGDRRLAVIQYQGALLRTAEQQKVGSWTVVTIGPHSAELSNMSDTLHLYLDATSHRE
jgi:hypothetical protein